MYQQISQHTDLPLVCSQYRQGGPTESGEQWLLSAQCLFFFVEVTVCIDRIKTAFSAFLRGSPRAVPHGGRQEGSAETRASFLQEWRAGGRQSGTTSLPGKVTKKKCYHTDSGSCSCSSSRNVNAVSVHSVGSPVISASQTPCRSWSTRAKPPLSRPVSPSSRGHPS